MQKKSSYHHGDLRSALLKTARELLEECGASALALTEVAKRNGVSPPAVYHHFSSREALAASLARQGFDELDQRMKAVAAQVGGGLADYAVAYVAFAREHPALYRLMFGEGFAGGSDEGEAVRAFRRPAYDGLKASLIAVVPINDVPYVALFLWALTHGLALLMIDGQLEIQESDAHIVNRVLSVARLGMAAIMRPG
ncbi:TetR/AcrR family transcriptional regulator [Asticcacaulis solisilvae]|uniref:TetR/AcrR family transcriptional regulator n=1 Tax=Asticcacaulis solisilvae TaxID=1217274 RepID=UPI003FD871EC